MHEPNSVRFSTSAAPVDHDEARNHEEPPAAPASDSAPIAQAAPINAPQSSLEATASTSNVVQSTLSEAPAPASDGAHPTQSIASFLETTPAPVEAPAFNSESASSFSARILTADTPNATAPLPPFEPIAASATAPNTAAPNTAAPKVSAPMVPVLAREPLAAEWPRPAATNPLLLLLAGGVLACGLLGLGMVLGARHTNATTDPLQQINGGFVGGTSGVNSDSGNAIVQAVQAVGPAVMNVDTKFGKGKTGSFDFLPAPGEENAPREGKGTGFVIDSKRGLMLTNAHVVAGAQKIQVTTREGKAYTGRLVGSDRANDIALVELSNKNLPQAKLANLKNARDLRIGEWAIAIGNPYAQANTVTVGVISAVGRTIGPAPIPGRPGQMMSLTDMVQTDAAINPGNSGGPLCNIHGEVIGINTAIIPFATGLGFTIPINKAKQIADMLLANGGKVPYMGIDMLPVTANIQKDFGLKDSNGALVKGVMPNSPAAAAKIQPGDVIRALDGKPVKDSKAIQDAVRTKKVGATVKLDVLRNNTVKQTLTLKIGSRPDE